MNKQERQRALRRLMKAKGWTCNDIAKRLDVHHVTVRNWSCGKFAVPKDVIAELEDRL